MKDIIERRFEEAVNIYKQYGVDVLKSIEKLKDIKISMNCWQGDDIKGFENLGSTESGGGIQSTGNYMGKAKNINDLQSDLSKAYSLIPGKHRLNLHASYGDFNGEFIDRDKIKPEHFNSWIKFALENDIKIDFNATFFGHPKSSGSTLSSYDENIRKFWVEHSKACYNISQYIADKLDDKVLYNIWIPDGLKDEPADRLGPRLRLKKSLDEILKDRQTKPDVYVSVESKLFGIGLESYTVGSHEFYMNYALKNDILCLIDSGHFNPTENIADKLSSLSIFYEKVALHLTRAVHWDSDHVIRLTNQIEEICSEIIKIGYNKFLIGVDFFDGSINRVAAWVIGMRNLLKALLNALLTNHELLYDLQNKEDFTKLIMIQEDKKTLPFGDVWNYYCLLNDVPIDNEWYKYVKEYERKVLSLRDNH